MKLKYQQGGSFIPPYAVYQPFQIPTAAPSGRTGGQSSENKGIGLKDIYECISKIDGLPGDIDKISNTMEAILSNIENKLNNPDTFGGTTSIASEYMQLLRMTSQLKIQKEQYIKARDKAVESGSIHEAVIDSRGRVMVMSEEGYDWITPEKLVESKGKYNIITNQELLDLRAHGHKGLALDMNSINAILNSVGIKQVTSLIQDVIKELGTNTNTTHGYVGVSSGQLIQSLEDYSKALRSSKQFNASVQDLYKVRLLSEDQAANAEIALQYIYNTLPEPAQALLKLKSNGTITGARALIGALVSSHLDTKQEFDPTLDKGSSSETSGKASSNPYLQYQVAEGGMNRQFTYITNSGEHGLGVNGTWYSTIAKQSGDMSVDAFLDTGILHITGGKNSISFGNQQLKPEDLAHVMISNEGAQIVTLPAKYDKNQVKIVNMDIIEEWAKVDKQQQQFIKDNPQTTKTQRDENLAKLLKSEGLDALIDPYTGLPNYNLFGQFMVLTAYTTDKVQFDTKSEYVHKITDPSTALDERMQKALSTNKDKNDYDIDREDWWELWGYDDFYKASLFIPLNNNRNAAITGWGGTASEATVMNNEQMYQDFEKLTQLKSTKLYE